MTRYILPTFPFLALMTHLAWSQVPTPTKPTPAAPRPPVLTSRDIRVLPFAREWKERIFKRNDREMPDELRVSVTADRIRISGKKKAGDTPRVGEKSVGNVGKLVLLPPGDRSGTLTAKFPTTEDVRYYFLVLELADGTLDSKDMKLAADTNYEWSARTDAGQTTLRVAVAGGTEVASSSAPSDAVKGVGFASTVRSQGNEVDVSITFK